MFIQVSNYDSKYKLVDINFAVYNIYLPIVLHFYSLGYVFSSQPLRSNKSARIIPALKPKYLTALNSKGKRAENYPHPKPRSMELQIVCRPTRGWAGRRGERLPDERSCDGACFTVKPLLSLHQNLNFLIRSYPHSCDLISSTKQREPIRQQKKLDIVMKITETQ